MIFFFSSTHPISSFFLSFYFLCFHLPSCPKFCFAFAASTRDRSTASRRETKYDAEENGGVVVVVVVVVLVFPPPRDGESNEGEGKEEEEEEEVARAPDDDDDDDDDLGNNDTCAGCATMLGE